MRAPRPPSPSGVFLELRGVGRRYGLRGPWVLSGIDLDVAAGTLVRIEGTNGTGKSTLLRLIAGIDQPTVGRVAGRPRTAYVPERFPAALPFTAADYLARMGQVHGHGRTRAVRGAGEWLERFGAAGHAHTPLAELSKGTSQKVAVVQALLADPQLLVLDEAWSGLDQRARAELDRAVAGRVAEGGTVVFVDHDPLRLAGAPDTVYRLRAGGLDRARPGQVAESGESAPPGLRVLIEAEGPPGADPPGGLPGAPTVQRAPDGAIRLTVPAAYSDALLRALLTAARPPWHIRTVTQAGALPTPREPRSQGVDDRP